MSARFPLAEVIVAAAIVLGGVFGLVIGLDYKVGSLTRMGPGFFPVALSVLVIVLGAASGVRAVLARQPAEGENLGRLLPLVWVAAGLVAWTFMLRPLGLLSANAALVILAALARWPVRPLQVVGLVAGLTISGWVIFIWGLGMPLTLLGR